MTEYSRMVKGTYTQTTGVLGASAGSVQVVNLPFKPDYVELMNLTQAITLTQYGIPYAQWDATSYYTTGGTTYNPTLIQINTSAAARWASVLTNGISAFSGGLSQQYGPLVGIVGISKAAQAVVTTTAAHGYSVGQTVLLQGIATNSANNMQLLNGVPFTIVSVGSTTTFTINWNTNQTQYTAIVGSPAGAFVKQVLYPFLYEPADNVISSVTLGAVTTIATTMYSNFTVGQEVAFRIPPVWGTYQLASLPNVLIPGSPMYGYVQSITDNFTFVVNINSLAFTPFTSNFVMTNATLPGLTYAQAVGVGDVNSGGVQYYGQSLYPSPYFPTFANAIPTINGPAIQGAFVNNTSQGFIVGNGVTNGYGTATTFFGGSAGDVIEYRAYLHDASNP